jgi:hypothetical protein
MIKGVFWCIVACKSELHAWYRAPIGFNLTVLGCCGLTERTSLLGSGKKGLSQ